MTWRTEDRDVPVLATPPPPRPLSFVEATRATEAVVGAFDSVDTYAPTTAELGDVYAAMGITPASSAHVTSAPSKWWNSSKEMDVDLNGHDFDFIPKENVGKENVEGFVDGPLSHNGWFKVLKNQGNQFKIKVNIGTNSKKTNDLDVVVSVVAGKATVTGTVQGTSLGEGVTATVKGKGTKASPFSLTFADSAGNVHTLEWRST